MALSLIGENGFHFHLFLYRVKANHPWEKYSEEEFKQECEISALPIAEYFIYNSTKNRIIIYTDWILITLSIGYMNIYQSIYSNPQYFNHLFFQSCFESIKGMTNQAIHLISKESITSIPEKLNNTNTKHIVIVSIFCSTIIAIILISRCIFKANSSSSHPSSDTDDAVKLDDPKVDDVVVKKVGYAKDKGIYKESKELAKKGEFQEAWSSYCYETYFDVSGMYPDNKKPYHDHTCSVKEWIELPSEELILGLMRALSHDQILERIPQELLKDCAIAYPNFFNKYLTKICTLLETDLKNIIDICKTSPVCGMQIVLEGIDDYIAPYFFDDKLFVELFQAIYPSLLKHIENKSLTDEEAGNLKYFLSTLSTSSVIEKNQIEEIIKLLPAASEKKN